MLTHAQVETIVDAARFVCCTPSPGGPSPHKIAVEKYGHHASYVKRGVRVWGFDDADKGALFMQDHGASLSP